jgi:Protein of unknown function (DUF4232)
MVKGNRFGSSRYRIIGLGGWLATVIMLSTFLNACSDLFLTATPVPTPTLVATLAPIATSTPAPTPLPTFQAPTPTFDLRPRPTETPSTIAPDILPCKAQHLAIDTSHIGNGATGHVFRPIYIVNMGFDPCTLKGHPRVVVTDENGKIDTKLTVRKESKVPPHDADPNKKILLGQGEAAYFVLHHYRCDIGYTNERRKLTAYLPDSQSSYPLQEFVLCKNQVSDRSVSAYDKAPMDWRSRP